MPSINLASRTFDSNGQFLFARISGDFNPIHIDPIAARRTQAGAVVVHGVHAILWALDKLIEMGIITEQIGSLNVQFTNFIYVGSQVELKLLGRDGKSVRAELSVGRLRAATLIVAFSPLQGVGETELPDSAPRISPASQPVNFGGLEEMASLCGWMDIAGPADRIPQYFPYASSAIGNSRVTAIALLSTLVGMICPGLHSLFGGFTVDVVDNSRNQDRIGFRVSETDDRFRMVRMGVAGAGILGSVQAFVRWPPISQASLNAIRNMVSPTEFAGSTTLIIGGSRGLGALTAKILAAGGGEVMVTYATGQEDAEALTAEIRNETATDLCHTFQYNIHADAAAQLKNLKTSVTHLYYFATGKIARQKDGLFEMNLFNEFIQMYVKAFYDCCVYLGAHGSHPLTAFYPSSVFVDSNPPEMAEYSMAKMVGEMLCVSMNRANGRVHTITSRLPPLLTDQTATVVPMERGDPLKVMLPVVREVQTSRFAQSVGQLL
jgi:acyl dehydratase